MLLQTILSSFIIYLLKINFQSVVLADGILDGRKCLLYEDVVTEAPKFEVEDIKTVVFNRHLPARTKVKYGQHMKLICDVHFDSPFVISWHKNKETLTNGVSDDHKVLNIQSITETYHGKYVICNAYFLSDPKMKPVNVTHGTTFVISDLAPPVISELTKSHVTMMENDNVTLSCIIVAGVPPPKMKWQVKRTGENEFRDLRETGEELKIEGATFTDVGEYRCIASNMRANATKTIDVTVQKVPVAVIKEGSEKTFSYATSPEFTCKIEGYPLPKAVWKDNQGNKLHSEDTMISWHEKISKLKLQKLKLSNNYTCYAESPLGKAVDSVNVTILSPFVVHDHPEEKTNIHYGDSANIVCNITSTFPMRIKWYRPKTANSLEQLEIHADTQYKITAHGTILEILLKNLDMVGNYTCEASLVSDKNEKKAYTTDVQIDNLAPPLMSDTSKITVMETNLITLFCKIVGGVPRPTLSWQVMRHGEKEYKDLPTTSEEFDLNITVDDSGKYRCVANNGVDERSEITEVLVRKAPVVVIEEGAEMTVAYGSNVTFTCLIVAYPQPRVAWIDLAGDPIAHKNFTIHEHKMSSKVQIENIKYSNTFYCHANNLLGEDEASTNVTVLSPFVVHQTPEDTTNVHYAAAVDLVCNVTSTLPMTIKWYHNTTEVQSSARQTISANKTVLHISKMELDLIGNYRCVTSLLSDVNEIKSFNTDVKIDDLRPPVITYYNGAYVTVKNLEEFSLVCNARGNPEPVVSWQYQSPGSSFYQYIGRGDSLCSTNFGSAQAGVYICTATNVAGSDSRTIHAVVYK